MLPGLRHKMSILGVDFEEMDANAAWEFVSVHLYFWQELQQQYVAWQRSVEASTNLQQSEIYPYPDYCSLLP